MSTGAGRQAIVPATHLTSSRTRSTSQEAATKLQAGKGACAASGSATGSSRPATTSVP